MTCQNYTGVRVSRNGKNTWWKYEKYAAGSDFCELSALQCSTPRPSFERQDCAARCSLLCRAISAGRGLLCLNSLMTNVATCGGGA